MYSVYVSCCKIRHLLAFLFILWYFNVHLQLLGFYICLLFILFFIHKIGCELGSLNQEEFSSSEEEFVGKAALKGIINNTAV